MTATTGQRRAAGAGTLALITTCVTGIVTSVTMIGPLLLDISRDLGISLGQAGLLAAAAAVPQALGSPFSGLLSDRFGRRPLIVLALGGVGLLGFAAALAPSFFVLAAIRFVAGLVGCLAPTSLMAAVGDLFPAERRSRAMGWFNMGFSFAAIAGVPRVTRPAKLFGAHYNEASKIIYQGVNQILNGTPAKSVLPSMQSKLNTLLKQK